jgi:Tol biopolymer transport system component
MRLTEPIHCFINYTGMTPYMPLSSGDKLGPYDVVAPIGAGGMGEVYRARDPRMGREVAIKVSAERFNDRFEREVHAVAALNHPHICHLYDVGPDYLVMELVEGPTLAERVGAGAIPLEESLAIARQIAEALEAAHEKGIIHRDLKPANVKITPEGVVKVLDFGLAKLADPASASQGAPDASPTLTIQQATRVGVILGTAAYMSPEQASGKPVDKRADIWSFGVVLYELLTGERLFDGETVSHTLAAVLTKDPDWSQLPGSTPASVRRLLRRCLERDRKRRLPDIAVARLEIDEAIGGDALGGAAPGIPKKSHWPERAAWIILAGTLLSVALFFAARTGRTPDSRALFRFAVYPPEKAVFAGSVVATVPVPQFALSPDGGAMVFAAAAAGAKPRLWVRAMEEVAARQLPGTENAQNPFWSPDSRWLGFFNDGRLLKVPAAGGPVQVITQGLDDSFGGSWGPDGTILIGSGTNPVSRVSSAGGTVTTVTKVDKSRQEQTHRWPQFLPDGRHFLLLVQCVSREQSGIYTGSFDGKPPKFLVRTNSTAVYAPPGYLLWVDGDALLGQAFDAERLQLSGQPFSLAEKVGRSTTFQGAVSTSNAGTMAYASTMLRLGDLTWFDRSGNPLGSVGAMGDYVDFRLSPDEKRLAVSLVDPSVSYPDVWVIELARGSTSRFTFGPEINAAPVWSPDGTRLVFRKIWGGLIEFYQKSSGGGGEEVSLLNAASESAAGITAVNMVPSDWSPDGRHIVYSAPTASGYDLWLMPLTGDRKPVRFLTSPSDQLHANFSPDGHLVAYTSNESGRFEVWVQTFPLSDRKWLVSTNGGYEPRWRGDGREIYYLSEDRKLMAVAVGAGPSFDAPKALFQTRVDVVVHANRTHYVPSRDGRRFLINTQIDGPPPLPITVVLNWTAGLKR